MRNSLKQLVFGFFACTVGFASAAQAGPASSVSVMPDRQVRPGVSLPVFGSANGGDGTVQGTGEPYLWTFTFDPLDVAVASTTPSGVVTNDRFIVSNTTFTLLAGVTRAVVTATLQVSAGPSASVKIDVVSAADPISDT